MKKILFIIAALAVSLGIQAQESDNSLNIVKESTGAAGELPIDYYDPSLVRMNEFHSNWEVNFGIGSSFYYGESENHAKLKDLWAFPSIDLSLWKWATPIFGLGACFNFSSYKSVYDAITYPVETYSKPDDSFYDGTTDLRKSTGSYGNIYLMGVTDLCNLFGGYNAARRFHCIFTYGAGFVFTINANQINKMGPSFNLGFMNQYDLYKGWAVNLNIRGAFIAESFDGQSWETDLLQNHSCGPDLTMDGSAGITVGVSYKFGWKKSATARSWIPMSQIVQTSALAGENAATKTINQASHDLTNVAAAATAAGVDVGSMIQNPNIIKDAKEKSGNYTAPKREVEYVREFNTNYRVLINFVIDKWDISHREEIIIKHAAEFINEAPEGVKFDVIGYADVQTATPDHNMFLSKNRAEIVTKMLVEKYHVDRNRLNISWVGGHDYLYFDDPQCTRSCIIQAHGSTNMVK